MAGVYTIQSLETGLFVFDDGQVNTSVILTEGPANLEISPPLNQPPKSTGVIKGRNGFYINLSTEQPPRKSDLAWSQKSYKWTFEGDQIYTVISGETLYWFLQYTDSWNIILNPYEASRFRFANAF